MMKKYRLPHLRKMGLVGVILFVAITTGAIIHIINTLIGPGDEHLHVLIDAMVVITVTTPLFYIFLKDIKQYAEHLERQLSQNKKAAEDLNRKNQALIESQERYRNLLDISPNAITVQLDGKFVYINRIAMKLLGAQSPEEVIGKSVFEVIPGEYHETAKHRIEMVLKDSKVEIEPMQYPIIRLDGKKIYVESVVAKIDYLGKSAVLAVTADVTERKKLEKKLHYMAYHDQLTGLPNRYLLNDHLQESLIRCRRNGQKLAVIYIDLDGFKFINDTKGHDVGDLLLKMASDRIVDALCNDSIVARIGGDEFVAVIERVELPLIKEIAVRIIDEFSPPFILDGEAFYMTPSVGISLFPDDGQSGEELIKNADVAMYFAKKRGKNNFQFFIDDPQDVFGRKIKLEQGLRKAIENNELLLLYQPKYELSSEKIEGVEALLRWNHPELGLVSPLEFIPIAEEIGMIRQIGEWVIETACKQMKQWMDLGVFPSNLAVNVSTIQFQDRNFAVFMKRILSKYGLEPCLLEIEITESVMQDVNESMATLTQLKELGIKISIDDFGTGYSSLNILHRLPIDFVKIDKSFVSEISTNSSTETLVKTIIELGKKLNFELIAEGIETIEQKNILLKSGCRFGQGYLYSQPLPPDEMIALLTKQYMNIEK